MWTEVISAFAIQWIAWVPASFFRTEKFYDITGSFTFTFLTLYNLWTRGNVMSMGQFIQSVCVLLWTARLGTYLFKRVLAQGNDRRFKNIKGKPAKFFFVWNLQAVWVLCTLAPTLVVWHRRVNTEKQPISWLEIVGWSLWATGFALEAIADNQKSVFRSNPENTDKFIQAGLWSVSRHPNYFGEILLWTGLFVSATSHFKSPFDYLTILSPFFDGILLMYVSGVPMLEAYADRKWGHDAAYQLYKRRTAVIIPFLW